MAEEQKIEVSKIEEIKETKIVEIKETKIETKKEVKIESSSGEGSSKETKDIEIETTDNKKTSTVESEDDSDDDIPDLEEENNVSSGIAQADNAKIQSRGEKKARKAMQKLGLKHVPGINRVTIRRPKNVSFYFNYFLHFQLFIIQIFAS
jgi:hypothetical protein